MPVLRLVSVDARAANTPRAEVAALIAAERPDLACVHGAPTGPRWRTACGALARESGLVVLGGGRVAGGTLLLASLAVDVLATRDVRLDGSPAWRPGPAAALALVRRSAACLVLAGARLMGDATTGQAQAAALTRAVAEMVRDGQPAVLSVSGSGSAAVEAPAGRRAVAPGLFVDDAIKLHGRAEDHGPVVAVELDLPG